MSWGGFTWSGVAVGVICGGVGLYRSRCYLRVQELCESRGGRPGLPVLMSLTVSVDVKQH